MGKAVLTDEQRAAILARKASDDAVSHSVLAKEFGVNKSTITRVLQADQDGKSTTPAMSSAPAALISAPHDRIRASTLNPRKRFDPAMLEELSESIEEKGVLQQLLVRYANQPGNTPVPDAQPGDFEIIAGERRWRAAGLVIARGAFEPSYPLPIRLVDPCDDLEHLKLAVTENTARNDMTPMEEAEAYAKFVEKGLAAPAIGKIVGRNARTVQKRLRLINDLTPKVRAAVADGDLHVEFANVLAAYCPKSKQDATLQEIITGRFPTSAVLKSTCLSVTIPEARAFFDTEKYKGGFVEDEEKPGSRYFRDVAQFEKLQMEAVVAKEKELAAKYGWVEIMDERKGAYFYSWNYKTKPGHAKAGAIIEIERDSSVIVHFDLVRERDLIPASTAAAAEPAAPEPTTKAHNAHAHRRKTEAMQVAVAANAVTAMKLVSAALLGATASIKINAEEIGPDDRAFAPAVKTALEQTLAALANGADEEIEFGSRGPRCGDPWANDRHVKIWQFVDGLSGGDTVTLFAQLVALRVGTFSGYNPSIGDDASDIAIAQSLGLVGTEEQHGLTLRGEDLEGVRKDTLLVNARLAGVDGKLSDMKAKDLAKYFSGMAQGNYVFPTLRFGTSAQLKALMQGHYPVGQTSPSISPAAKTKSLSDAEMDACIVVQKGPSSGISAAEVEMTSGCSRDDVVKLIGDAVLRCAPGNFLSRGMNFPPEIILTAHAAQRVKEPSTGEAVADQEDRGPMLPFPGSTSTVIQQLEKVAQQSLQEGEWHADDKLAEIAQAVGDEYGTIIVKTDGEIRRALTQGINACRQLPLDTPIDGNERFDSYEPPVYPDVVINQIFEIYSPLVEYVPTEDLDEAVVFVCNKLNIVPTFVSRRAAE